MLASSDYSVNKVVLTTNKWNENIGIAIDHDGWITDDDAKSTMHYKLFNDDVEWNFLAFKGGIEMNYQIS